MRRVKGLIVPLFLVCMTMSIEAVSSSLTGPRGTIGVSQNMMTFDSASNHFRFYNGNFGVGINTPNAELDVLGTISANTLSVKTQINAEQASFNGTVSAASFSGDGAGITNVTATVVPSASLVDNDISPSAALDTSKFEGSAANIANHGLHAVAFSGDVNELSNTPNKIIFFSTSSNTTYEEDTGDYTLQFNSISAQNILKGACSFNTATSTLTINKSTTVFVQAWCTVMNDDAPNDDSQELYIEKNSTTKIAKVWIDPEYYADENEEWRYTISAMVQVSSGDTIRIRVEHVASHIEIKDTGLTVFEL